ncbi:30S ribosomal protein S6 modification protein RimK [Paenibacillus swuensis]|uniref:30S ribosomal protein S6 modification protein RimK n=1 Tax=Paenibacillus swuensis TaxID=1178515 RepID=A0A172TH83_9BACL|nr:RimK family alpha-L-glutamate ligase [Paenibacillus swuensis]ANE46380.1 30S ribosomal protein S6 modification protein RimK [Paenibacillus swuensis]
MENSSTVLLCVTKLREEERRIMDYLSRLGIRVQVNLDSMELPVGASDVPSFGVALIRCLSQKNAISRTQLLELAGLETLNSGKAITICTNKIHQAIVFDKHGIPQPRFQVVFTPAKLFDALQKFGDLCVIKPATSSWGRGIARVTGKECLEGWIAARESVDPSHQSFPVLVQEYVEKGDHDIRVVIVGRKPIVAFRRVSAENWKTNTHLGAEIEPIEINREIASICGDLVAVLGKGIYGADLFFDYQKLCYVVCEVNQNPEFAKSWKIHGVDVAHHIAEYVKEKIDTKIKVNVTV